MKRRQLLAAAALGLLPGCTAGAARGSGAADPLTGPDPWPGIAFAHEPPGPVRGLDVAPDGRVALLAGDGDAGRSVLTVFGPAGRVLVREPVALGLEEPSYFVPVRLRGDSVLLQTDRLAVVDASDASVAWRSRLFHLPNVVADGVGYGRGRRGLYAATLEDGSVRWSRPVLASDSRHGFGWPVALLGDRLVVVGGSADRGFVQARDPDSGSLIWHYEVPGEFPPVAFGPDTVYVGTNDAPADGEEAVVAALDAGPGMAYWRRPFPGAAFAHPLVGPGGVAVDLLAHESLDRAAVLLDDRGEVQWRTAGVEVEAVGDRPYGLDSRNRVVAFTDGGGVDWARDVLGRAPNSGYNGIGGSDVVAVPGGALGVTADRVALVTPEGRVAWHVDPPKPIRGIRFPGGRWTVGRVGGVDEDGGEDDTGPSTATLAAIATRQRLTVLGR